MFYINDIFEYNYIMYHYDLTIYVMLDTCIPYIYYALYICIIYILFLTYIILRCILR